MQGSPAGSGCQPRPTSKREGGQEGYVFQVHRRCGLHAQINCGKAWRAEFDDSPKTLKSGKEKSLPFHFHPVRSGTLLDGRFGRWGHSYYKWGFLGPGNPFIPATQFCAVRNLFNFLLLNGPIYCWWQNCQRELIESWPLAPHSFLQPRPQVPC